MILFIDPGETTGYAVFGTNKMLVTYGQEKFSHDGLYQRMLTIQPSVIYCESFRLFAHKSQQQIGSRFLTAEMIGVIRLYCERSGIAYEETTPAKVKSIWTNEKLKKHGIYVKKMPHANDAIRHGLTILQRHVTIGTDF